MVKKSEMEVIYRSGITLDTFVRKALLKYPWLHRNSLYDTYYRLKKSNMEVKHARQ